jgi:hypothetical protein
MIDFFEVHAGWLNSPERIGRMKDMIDKSWRHEASRFGISRSEQDYMSAAFDWIDRGYST